MRNLTLLFSIILFSVFALAQDGERGLPGYCAFACGPYVPLISTPSLSFTTVSPNPAGATNSTGGLIAGATNSTLSEINGNTNPVYTVPVWYSGGGMPLVSPATNSPVGGMRLNAMRREEREREPGHEERARKEHGGPTMSWVYIASAEPGASSLASASAASGVHPSKKSFTNDDVQRQNDKNGYVHYDSKTEKIQ